MLAISTRFACVIMLGGMVTLCLADDVDPRVTAAEAKRVAAVEKVRASVVAVFGPNGQGGGSGVVISKDGYALTNFHVVEGAGNVMQCGMPDGVLYDAVLVGLDRVGDVALIKLVPPNDGFDFPAAPLGDSDKVKAGDWSLAMGNPFLLATDFQPTVTFGMVSGVHRYQYPAGTLLEYTDCIQVDTSINPGNSGGPLFNMDGELIGINGRGSFEKRGRVNSGVGYAISINQIKNFMGHLRAGLDTDHATLGALIQTETTEDEGTGTRLLVTSIIEASDVHRRGVDIGDEVVAFAERPITSLNQYKNVLGLFPKEWRMPLVYRRENDKHEVLVRLMKLQRAETNPDAKKPRPRPGPPRPQPPKRKSAATAFFEAKPGFANYYFNKLERDRLWASFKQHGDFSQVVGDWTIEGVNDKNNEVKIAIREEMEDKGPDGQPIPRDDTYHLKSSMLPELPPVSENESDLRGAVRRAVALMDKHRQSFPQEYWAEETEEKLRDRVSDTQKDVVAIQAKLLEALDTLNTAGAGRSKETTGWKAYYDMTLARLSGFCAYVHEYNFLLAQLRKDPPKRDPQIHRGWRMNPEAEILSGNDAKKLAAESRNIWDKMIEDYKATPFAERAEHGRKTPIGLKWVPTGGTKTMVRLNLGAVRFNLDPLKLEQEVTELKQPTGSGGLMAALYQYRRLLTLGAQGFEGKFEHGGHEPFYPPMAGGAPTSNLGALRVDCEVLRTEHAAIPAKWYFSLQDQTLLGFEVTVEEDQDPCEVYFYDYQKVDGRSVPHRMEVRHGNNRFTTFTVKSYQLAATR